MKGVIRCVLYCLVSVSACHQPAAVVTDTQADSIKETKIPPASVTLPLTSEDSSLFRRYKKRMEKIDDSIYYYQQIRRYFPEKDSLWMNLYISRKRPVKLVYGKHGNYYFDAGGNVFARYQYWSEEHITGELFEKYNTVIAFNTTIYTDNWKLQKLGVVEAMERKAACIRELDSLMGKFPRVSYRLR